MYFLAENMILSLVGIVIGILLAILMNQQLMSYYAVAKLDTIYIAVTTLCVITLGQLAVIMPAKRAANISPAIATRSA